MKNNNMREIDRIVLWSNLQELYIESEDKYGILFVKDSLKAKDFSNILVFLRPFYKWNLEYKWGERLQYKKIILYEGLGLV